MRQHGKSLARSSCLILGGRVNFSQWQIDKLRRGINAYRLLRQVNGRPRPWSAVLDDILLSPVTEHVYPADGDPSPFREEALRRFAIGTSTLEPDKLDDLRRFLVHRSIVSAEELVDDRKELEEALKVHSLLGASHAVSTGLIDALAAQPLISSRAWEGNREAFVVVVIARPEKSLLLVEERQETYALNSDGADASAKPELKDLRKGFAFVGSADPTLHIFVRGIAADDLIHYVSVPSHAPLSLLRSGSPLPPSLARDGSEAAMLSYNTLAFEPLVRPALRR